jgi:hypothetical protein|nr:MAG TPA: hypothetical protein [Caudoviricetes sp.]
MNYKEYLEQNIKQIIHECEQLEPPYHICFTHQDGKLKHLINPEPQDIAIVELFSMSSIMELSQGLDFDAIDEKLKKLSNIEHCVGQSMGELVDEVITIQKNMLTYLIVNVSDHITISVDSSWIHEYTCLGQVHDLNLPDGFLIAHFTEEQIDARCDDFMRLVRKLKGDEKDGI